MNHEEKKKIMARVSDIGEQTRAAVFVELTHEGRVSVTASGQLLDVSFCATNLNFYVTESLAGRLPEQQKKV